MANANVNVRVDITVPADAILRVVRVKNIKAGQVIRGAKLEITAPDGRVDQYVIHVPTDGYRRQELEEALQKLTDIIINAPDAEAAPEREVAEDGGDE